MLSFACRAFVLISIASPAAEVLPLRPCTTADVFDKPIVFSIRGSGTDSLQDLATDAGGNVYVAGTTTSTDLPVTNTATPPTIAANGAIGAQADGRAQFFTGAIDDVRISNVERSADWIEAEYRNQGGGGFVSFGPEERR